MTGTAAPPAAPMPGVKATVRPLDLANLLRHAFMFGFQTMGGTADAAKDWWPVYDPEDCPAFARILSALDVPAQPEGVKATHSDDSAVDRFAVALKAKLAKKRDEGRGGWDRKNECTAEFLSSLLREHVEKGDPVDVGNLAMMLHQRGERIS